MDTGTGRTVSVAFGIFFVALAFLVLFVAWDTAPLGACIVSLVLAVLGVDGVFSAYRNKRSLLSRIGPLP